MLTQLRIRDFAIIESLDLDLDPGFVVFTGETGAGKSIIIDAVELLLGGRADTNTIRSGASVALIEGSYTLDEYVREPVTTLLEAEGLLDEPTRVELAREIRREGRNICRINGRTVSLALLSEVGQWLVDVHGQSEHLSLLRVREHLDLLDRYAQTSEVLAHYKHAYQSLRQVRASLHDLQQREQDAAQRADFLRFQIDEVQAAGIKPDDELALRDERTRLANAEQLAQLSEQLLASLTGGLQQASASDALGRAVEALRSLAKTDSSMQVLYDNGQGLADQINDLARQVRAYREKIEFNPNRLDDVEERLSLLASLKRKYGASLEQVLDSTRAAELELERIEHAGENMQALQDDERRLVAELGELGQQLSDQRRRAGEELSSAIETELEDLRMSGARFGLDLRWKDDPQGALLGDRHVALGPSGLDQVEFLVEPNPGEGLKPLARIASGGETSRLMLGMKSVLARADHTPTLIFDEIDQGIGGRVGTIVGRKLWGLTESHQVLCITHLPQLAAYGDQHYRVEKQAHDGRTITTVSSLDDENRILEMASMLGGETEPNLESAAELLHAARQAKQPA
jgi:DNA repair protein RecN (Recombination protein N)